MNEPKDEIRLERLGDQFVDAWANSRHGEEVNLDEFLPPVGDPCRADGIRHLVPIDLEHRISRGENVLLDAYVERFPELGPRDELSVELIHDELRIRQRHDHRVQLESYRDRFPSQFEALADLDRLSQTKKMSGTLRPPKLTTIETSSEVPKLPVIQTDEGYKLKRRLGRGQFGEVWSAEAPGGVEVAVKIISFPIEHEMTQLELKSLEVMKRLRHAFLVQVQAYWFDDDRLFIVMELGDETLQDLGERHAKSGQPIPLPKLLGYFREASDAVDFLHRENVLHRDIKPANILLASGHVKVADFGISRVLGERGLTVTATTMGTPLYMAPEVWNGRASAHSDQYSLAMTYAELRMGRPPYSSTSLAAVMNDHLKSLPNLDLLEAAEKKVISKALAKDVNARFDSCTEFSNALQEALLPKTSLRKQERPRFPIVVMSAVMAIILLVVSAAIWWPSPATEDHDARCDTWMQTGRPGGRHDDQRTALCSPDCLGVTTRCTGRVRLDSV